MLTAATLTFVAFVLPQPQGDLDSAAPQLDVSALCSPQGGKSPRASLPKDPWTKGKDDGLRAANWKTKDIARWTKDHSPDDLRSCLTPTPVLMIETPHFTIASTLRAQKFNRKNKRGLKLLRADLARLQKKFPDLKVKRARFLDPWLRLYLLALRLEEQHELFEGLLRGEAKNGIPDQKTCVLVLGRTTELERWSAQHLGRQSKFAVRDKASDKQSITAISAEQGVFHDDRHLNGGIAFNVAHCLFNNYKADYYELPIWFREGLAHWFAQEIDPREVNRTQGTNGKDVTMLQNKDWTELSLQLVKSKAMTPLSELFEGTDYSSLRFRDHIACWSRVDYMIKEHAEGFSRFLDRIKGQKTAAGGSLQGEAVMECVRTAFRDCFGDDPDGFDAKWLAWVKSKPWRRSKKKAGKE